jgi:hypothetical protein
LNCNQPDPKKKYDDDSTKWPKRNCTIIKSVRELILDYLTIHPQSTYDEICKGLGRNCSGGIAKVEYHLACMVAVGEIMKKCESDVYYLAVTKTEVGEDVLQ